MMLHAIYRLLSHRGESDGMYAEGVRPGVLPDHVIQGHLGQHDPKKKGKWGRTGSRKPLRKGTVKKVPLPCTPTVRVQGNGTHFAP